MTTSHSNVVALICSDITDVRYVENSIQITDGQPVTSPPTVNHTDQGLWEITTDCGRSNSSKVANSFNTAVGSPNHSWTSGGFDEKPSELNFYFAVDITFSGVSTPVRVYLAQGNEMHIINNWWIGGSPVILNTYPAHAGATFFYVSPSKIYLVAVAEADSGEKEILNTFTFDLNP